LITVSNDINEEELIRLKKNGHEINSYGIGTHLVTCQKQPALGGVYKLVDIGGVARVKVSDSAEKTVLPGKKDIYRLFDETGKEIADYLTLADETVIPGEIKGHYAYGGEGELTVIAAEARPLYTVVWENGIASVDPLTVARDRVLQARKTFNPQVMAVENEKPYPVLLSPKLQNLLITLVEGAQRA
jgi:nicotinate phosphoribosyltransferase